MRYRYSKHKYYSAILARLGYELVTQFRDLLAGLAAGADLTLLARQVAQAATLLAALAEESNTARRGSGAGDAALLAESELLKVQVILFKTSWIIPLLAQ